jgi:hypothetical protein
MGMLTQLSAVKLRLNLGTTDDDILLTRVISMVGARFDMLCNRRFARECDTTEEFGADETEIRVACYPVESVLVFSIKRSEREGWETLDSMPEYVVRHGSVVSLSARLGSWRQVARVTYTGGYVLPGEEKKAGQTYLPEDIENACIEQVAYWYQNRSRLGLTSVTDSSGLTTLTLQEDLIASVQSTLDRYVRWLV